MDHQNQLKAAQTFASDFGASFAESLTHRTESSWLLKLSDDAEIATQMKSAVHFRLTASGGLQGGCFVAIGQERAIALEARLLERPVSELGDEQGGALAEVIESAMEGLSSVLATQFGTVSFKVDRVEDFRLHEMLVIPMAALEGDMATTPLLLYFNEQLVESIASSSGCESSSKTKRSAIDPSNLKLVMDVELNVSLRFGQCQLPLRDVLDLTSGSVIELDRDVDDPVELLLDGRVIARGEAVIVDGNYGLRITEIPEPIASHFVS